MQGFRSNRVGYRHVDASGEPKRKRKRTVLNEDILDSVVEKLLNPPVFVENENDAYYWSSAKHSMKPKLQTVGDFEESIISVCRSIDIMDNLLSLDTQESLFRRIVPNSFGKHVVYEKIGFEFEEVPTVSLMTLIKTISSDEILAERFFMSLVPTNTGPAYIMKMLMKYDGSAICERSLLKTNFLESGDQNISHSVSFSVQTDPKDSVNIFEMSDVKISPTSNNKGSFISFRTLRHSMSPINKGSVNDEWMACLSRRLIMLARIMRAGEIPNWLIYPQDFLLALRSHRYTKSLRRVEKVDCFAEDEFSLIVIGTGGIGFENCLYYDDAVDLTYMEYIRGPTWRSKYGNRDVASIPILSFDIIPERSALANPRRALAFALQSTDPMPFGIQNSEVRSLNAFALGNTARAHPSINKLDSFIREGVSQMPYHIQEELLMTWESVIQANRNVATSDADVKSCSIVSSSPSFASSSSCCNDEYDRFVSLLSGTDDIDQDLAEADDSSTSQGSTDPTNTMAPNTTTLLPLAIDTMKIYGNYNENPTENDQFGVSSIPSKFSSENSYQELPDSVRSVDSLSVRSSPTNSACDSPPFEFEPTAMSFDSSHQMMETQLEQAFGEEHHYHYGQLLQKQQPQQQQQQKQRQQSQQIKSSETLSLPSSNMLESGSVFTNASLFNCLPPMEPLKPIIPIRVDPASAFQVKPANIVPININKKKKVVKLAPGPGVLA